jgi:hypothetical protein
MGGTGRLYTVGALHPTLYRSIPQYNEAYECLRPRSAMNPIELNAWYGRMHYPGRSRSLQRAEGARSTRGMA